MHEVGDTFWLMAVGGVSWPACPISSLVAPLSDLIDQLRQNAGGHDFERSFGGGMAMMIQIGHRESHDIDIFLDDPQLLGFIDPSRTPPAL
ncbi:nucleotidyl transferase AbiEii/AbiGii toxin family protein (plasmid) [Mesorhizobium sp. AR07]|uniref:Nucleotidyl transferase AbiEii/AbiGii toxin family protein n=1 Tax=Mesorhizobium huakuii TaxID=28104 RepID=A0A7G6T5B6_9HYPH|nr:MULTISPECIES: nucleotidyl transferase AbiEii/AbiGii toxin family protein [Mesorhizobium]QND61948.1 nucleotidyl transferase AbiEii/AbiGii toxin family protein [Mesorhizobium huakuii]QND69331.1 nucleotidyl transferase AbiEii/AbiGii toxin family protein [Mesorhizobium loti]UVK49316.1 nucleotidyl transferase AbiEii/AbiGii toxin family protein [Mesorhizobium sp. AR07]